MSFRTLQRCCPNTSATVQASYAACTIFVGGCQRGVLAFSKRRVWSENIYSHDVAPSMLAGHRMTEVSKRPGFKRAYCLTETSPLTEIALSMAMTTTHTLLQRLGRGSSP